jgi:uncharacterized membrane protein YozB (DUF420 family)
MKTSKAVIRLSWLIALLALVAALFLVFGVINPAVLAASSITPKFVQMALLISCASSDLLLVLGVWFLRRSPLRAYHWFKRAILLSILLTQVFMFYTQQLGALDELAINLIVLLALNALIGHHHRALQQEKLVQSPLAQSSESLVQNQETHSGKR